MDVISTIESAAHSAVEAVEHPFHTIGARLTAIRASLASFFGHPYCAPPIEAALTDLHGVVTDLAQEVAELRVPCPCKPAPTSAAVVAESSTLVETPAQAPAGEGLRTVDDDAAEIAEFKAWKADRDAKRAAAQFAAV